MRFLADESCDFAVVTALRTAGHETAGVLLIRFPGNARGALGGAVVSVVAELGDRIAGAFVVIEPGRARVSRPRR